MFLITLLLSFQGSSSCHYMTDKKNGGRQLGNVCDLSVFFLESKGLPTEMLK